MPDSTPHPLASADLAEAHAWLTPGDPCQSGDPRPIILRLSQEVEDWREAYAAGRLVSAGGEPDLWQYAYPAGDDVIEFIGKPAVMSPRVLRRPMRAVGPWQPVPTEGDDRA